MSVGAASLLFAAIVIADIRRNGRAALLVAAQYTSGTNVWSVIGGRT